MSYVNFKIKSNKDRSTFYTSSKEPVEGYKKIDLDTKGVFYHKEVSNISGVLTNIKMRDGKFGQTLEIYFEQPNKDIHVLSTNIFRSGTNIDDFTKSIIKLLPNLVIGEIYELWLNNKLKDKRGFPYKSVYASKIIGDTKEKVAWAFDLSEIPSGEKVANPVTGDETWNFDKNNAFYYAKLKEIVSSYTVINPEQKQQDEVLGFSGESNTDDTGEIPF